MADEDKGVPARLVRAIAPAGASDKVWLWTLLPALVASGFELVLLWAWATAVLERALVAFLTAFVVLVASLASSVGARFYERQVAEQDRAERDRLRETVWGLNDVIRQRLFLRIEDLVVLARSVTMAVHENTIAFPAAGDLEELIAVADTLCDEVAAAVRPVLAGSAEGVDIVVQANMMVVAPGAESDLVRRRLEALLPNGQAYVNPYSRLLRHSGLALDGCSETHPPWVVAFLVGNGHDLPPILLRVPRAPRDVIPGAPRALWAMGESLGLVEGGDEMSDRRFSYQGTRPPPLELISDTHDIPNEHTDPAKSEAHEAVEGYFQTAVPQVRGLVSVAAYSVTASGPRLTAVLNVNISEPGRLAEDWARHVTQAALLPFLPLAADLGAAILSSQADEDAEHE